MIWVIIAFLLISLVFVFSLKKIEGMTTNDSRLFLYPEAKGFEIPELENVNNLMEPSIVSNNFTKIAVIANASYSPKTTLAGLSKQWNHALPQKLSNESNVPIEKWASFYFGDYEYGENQVKEIFPDLTSNPNNIVGIIFDNEGVDTKQVVKLFETLNKNIGIQIGWTLAPGSAKNIGPKDPQTKKVEATIEWNVCLGQAYTEGIPGTYYKTTNTNCSDFSDNFWMNIAKEFGCPSLDTCDSDSKYVANFSRGVPMICGAGNCQEKFNTIQCFDERMTPDNISNLIERRPSGYPWNNFAIWYGTGQQPFCSESIQCMKLSESSCSDNCKWYPYKKNPNTHETGVCLKDANKNWGCKEWV
jgi:hypothetical protein